MPSPINLKSYSPSLAVNAPPTIVPVVRESAVKLRQHVSSTFVALDKAIYPLLSSELGIYWVAVVYWSSS